ncbi:MAG: flavodoxin family protein [Nanobdellota archaeon]
MKVVILDGTHNKEGKTLKIANGLIEGLSLSKNDTLSRFDLLNMNISFCKGCNKCVLEKTDDISECPIKDDFKLIRDEALSADLVVFANPIYEYCVSSSMKRFLERCLVLTTFRFGPSPKLKPKMGKFSVIICSSGAPFPFNHLMGITWYPRFILRFASKIYRCDKIHTIYAGGAKNYIPKAKTLGKKIAGAIRKN